VIGFAHPMHGCADSAHPSSSGHLPIRSVSLLRPESHWLAGRDNSDSATRIPPRAVIVVRNCLTRPRAAAALPRNHAVLEINPSLIRPSAAVLVMPR
jgi:hypothetical protein